MKKLHTLTELQDHLDNDFAWRIQEISNLKTAIKNSVSISQRTLIRAAITMLYAHWEGFVKNASEAYLNYISNQGLSYRQLRTCLISVGVQKHLNTLNQCKKAKKNVAIIEFLLNELDSKANIISEKSINTRSNLNSEVFENIATSLGFSIANYEAKFNLIDESLLNRRNTIAHGQFLDIDKTRYLDLNDEIVALMRAYKNDIENSLVLSSFRCNLAAQSN
jgi:hypothetical protein